MVISEKHLSIFFKDLQKYSMQFCFLSPMEAYIAPAEVIRQQQNNVGRPEIGFAVVHHLNLTPEITGNIAGFRLVP